MDLIGKVIGNRYEIITEVGDGGMATVYKAKDNILNRLVAIKILKDEFTTDQEFVKRFNTEAQSAARLTHPNIVSVFDVGYEEEYNIYYIVMELIKGKTLKEIIVHDGALSWKWAVNIAMQIASALEAAHKENIIHRDIKPHNIIITEEGVAKVTDFGIAKAVSNSTITAFGTTIGSVHYFSPEQAKGGVTDAKSDIYSLGVVMYEMLTAKVPFDADTPVSVALKHMQEEPIEPIEINDEIPSAVNSIVMKAMQKDPINRYQTATEMISDLGKALKDPNGNFVIIQNKDGAYTRVMRTIEPKKQPQNNKKRILFIAGLVAIFFLVFGITKVALNGGFTAKVEIPNVVGKTSEEATKAIANAKLEFKTVEAASKDVEVGKVISQEPSPASGKVKKGTLIQLIISKGPETTELPDFKGKNIEDVRKTAQTMGLILNEVQESSDKVNENLVISQDIAAGKMVKSGDKITLKVSTGYEKTRVPTVVGMDEGTAKATLANANLKTNITYENDDTHENGKVISQSIEQNKEVKVGTTIELKINKIEKKEKTVTLKFKVPGTSSVTTNTTNTTATANKVAVQIIVNNRIVADYSKDKGENVEFSLKGTGSQDVKIKIDGTTRLTRTFNIEDVSESVIID